MIDNLNDVVIRIPEYIIYEGLISALKQLRTDFAANSADETKSLLYLLFRNVGIQRYQYFEQAKTIFIENDVDSPRMLNLQMMGNRQKNSFPSVHMTLASEQPAQNSLSLGEGDQEPEYTDFDSDGKNGFFRPSYSRRFQTTYSLVVTSDNENEVVVVYHLLRALLISLTTHFALAGLDNISYGGADLKNYNREIPHDAYIRAINMNLQYKTETFDFSKIPMVNKMFFYGEPYDNGTTTTTTTQSNP